MNSIVPAKGLAFSAELLASVPTSRNPFNKSLKVGINCATSWFFSVLLSELRRVNALLKLSAAKIWSLVSVTWRSEPFARSFNSGIMSAPFLPHRATATAVLFAPSSKPAMALETASIWSTGANFLKVSKSSPSALMALAAPMPSSSVFDSAEVSLMLAAAMVSKLTPDTSLAFLMLARASAVSPIFSLRF